MNCGMEDCRGNCFNKKSISDNFMFNTLQYLMKLSTETETIYLRLLKITASRGILTLRQCVIWPCITT